MALTRSKKASLRLYASQTFECFKAQGNVESLNPGARQILKD
jgi:hypothetical protein